jgi:hypothetical protein
MESGDSTYTMYDYTKRTLGAVGDKIEKLPQKTLKFSFDLEDLTPVYIAETLRLNNYTILLIKEKRRLLKHQHLWSFYIRNLGGLFQPSF